MAVVVWALVATGLLGWTLAAPRGPSQTAIWDSDARILGQLGILFGLTRDSLEHWGATGNRSFGVEALNLTVAAYHAAASGELYGPGNFASGVALNLTAPWLQCDYNGLFYVVASSASGIGPNLLPGGDIWTIWLLYGNLSDLLYNRVIWSGQDPLAQLGSQRVAEIRTQADGLHARFAGFAHAAGYNCPST